MIRTRGLTKRFGRLVAVDSLDLDVGEGHRYGFLGPNGSGKTTTVRMLLGLVFATAGEIELLGQRTSGGRRRALRDVGAIVEAPAAYRHLSARTNLDLIDAAGPAPRASRASRIEEALARVGLDGVGRQPVGEYSLGMRARLGLASALLRRPRLLVLDEPTNGLDPQGIREVRDLLLELNAAGTTLFLSSHQLAEVNQLCDRVGVIDRGRLVAQGALAELCGPTGRALVRVSDPVAAVAALDGRVEARDGDRLTVAGMPVPDLTRLLVERGVGVLEAGPELRTLEDVVLSITGHGSDRLGGSQ